MQRIVLCALAMSACGMPAAIAQTVPSSPGYYPSSSGSMQVAQAQPAPVQYAAYREQRDMGGGFIEFLFGGGNGRAPRYELAPSSQPAIIQQQAVQQPMMQEPEPQPMMVSPQGSYAYGDPIPDGSPARPAMDPRYMKQMVNYAGPEKPGTLIIDTPQRFLFLVQPGGKALRYGIGVGKPGFTWSGVKQISAKREWPDWRPPEEMLQRRPDLPHFMAGGPENPLGARAMYLGSSLYRIHGSNEPWTIGHAVSSGCIRMRNEDVVDLYERVKVGTRVIVI